MPASFQCSECGFATKVKDSLAGKKIKCPKCQAAGKVAGAQAASPAKPQKNEDSEADLMSVNLDSFQDVEVPEGETLDESQPVKKPKTKKKKKKGSAIDPQIKAAAIAFSLISFLVIAGIVYLAGPPAMEEYQAYMEKKNNPPEAKKADNAQAPAQ